MNGVLLLPGLELVVILPHSPKFWDYSCAPRHLAENGFQKPNVAWMESLCLLLLVHLLIDDVLVSLFPPFNKLVNINLLSERLPWVSLNYVIDFAK